MQDYEFSSEFSFVTPPLTSPSASVKFLAIADLGSAEIDGSMEHTEMLASLNTTARLAQETEHHQLLIHNGDISYARGFASIWDAYAFSLHQSIRKCILKKLLEGALVSCLGVRGPYLQD